MQTHSVFFDGLSNRGHELSFVQAESPDLLIKKFGEYLFDNIVLFAPTVEEFNTITPDDILDFIARGGNLLMAVDETMSDTVRLLAESVGVEFDGKETAVIDHFMNEPSVDRT
jgi:oligosaccharyltransferase complex subunit beta